MFQVLGFHEGCGLGINMDSLKITPFRVDAKNRAVTVLTDLGTQVQVMASLS